MSNHEDFFYEVYNDVHSKGISEIFYKQLDKMRYQEKHKHKTVKDHWEYAYNKVVNISKAIESSGPLI